MKKPVALIIMDGFGYNPDSYGNAIADAKKPNLDKLFAECPHTLIGASGFLTDRWAIQKSVTPTSAQAGWSTRCW